MGSQNNKKMTHLKTSLLITVLVAGMSDRLTALADGKNAFIDGSHIVRFAGNLANKTRVY